MHIRTHLMLKRAVGLGLCLLALVGLLRVTVTYQAGAVFADSGLEAAIRSNLDRPTGRIARTELRRITHLDASGRGISRLDGIEHLRRLSALNLENNQVRDVSPLRGLDQLTELNLRGNGISCLEAARFPVLSGANVLRSLDLRNNRISDLAALRDLEHLHALDLRQNQVADLAPLRGLRHLERLNLRDNMVEDITALASLPGLVYLNLHSNPNIASLMPLTGLVNLQTLILRHVPVRDQLHVLGAMDQLRELNLRNCELADASPLAPLLRDGSLRDDPVSGARARIDLRNNPLPDAGHDPYAGIRIHWANIFARQPLTLPYFAGSIPGPEFSHASGFHESDIHLALYHPDPDARIYYTTDGSEPTVRDGLYGGPLHLRNPTDRQDNEGIFRGTVVRAVAVSGEDQVSPIVTRTFFIHPLASQRYSLPVVAIALNDEYLFDEAIGIYTTENAARRGKAWERSAHLDFWKPDGTVGFSRNVGIRIHGQWSRQLPMKSLRIYARDEYDQGAVITHPLFMDPKHHDISHNLGTFNTFLLRNSGNDWDKTMFRDAFMQHLLASRHVEKQSYRPVVVFINGKYWGVYNLRELYDKHYFYNKLNIRHDNLALLYGDAEIVEGCETDRKDFLKLRSYAEENDLKIDFHYSKISKSIDIQSFIDHYVTNIYSHNWDWPFKNIIVWRSKINNSRDYLEYSQWRWGFQDMDHGFHQCDCLQNEFRKMNDTLDWFVGKYMEEGGPSSNTLQWAVTRLFPLTEEEWPNSLLRNLLDNEAFRHRFINTMADYLNSVFQEDRVLALLSVFQERLAPEIQEHITRWQIMDRSVDTWRDNIERMRDFARKRPDFVRNHFAEYFQLDGTVAVTVSTDPAQGFITVNRLPISAATPGVSEPASWTGRYFSGIPIRITATPLPGYMFLHWQESGSTDPALDLTPSGDLSWTAVFAPVACP